MFTGIVSHCGVIQEINNSQVGKRFVLATEFADLKNGESIAVDGVCLTVTQVNGSNFSCDLSPETLSKTVANYYEVGAWVNLERALLANDRLGGHFVSGHVDETAKVTEIEKHAEFWKIRFEPKRQVDLKFVVSKGSVAINGVSLTVNHVDDNGFDVMLIPHTLEMTNLKYLEVGRVVNIEFDMLAKMVAKQVEVVAVNV